VIKREFNQTLIEDKVLSFESAKNYQFYFGTFNLEYVLAKLGI